jgi:DNA primase
MSNPALDELKRQIPLLDYLQAQDWRPARQLSRGRWMGLCPLHNEHQPSFLVDPHKSLFYCYGCGRGGDVIRFVELYHQVRFPQALTLLRQWCSLAPVLHATVEFYRVQLHRHGEAIVYLHQRGLRAPEVIEYMRIGYAPGGCLRGWLTRLGYSMPILRQAGLVTALGYDTYMHRIVFPLEGNLYGRSLSTLAPPHRFLPGTKGGLYLWEPVRRLPDVILVEGLSTTPSCGRPVFTTSPVRWGAISMYTSFSSYATGTREPSISPLTPTATAAVNRRPNSC